MLVTIQKREEEVTMKKKDIEKKEALAADLSAQKTLATERWGIEGILRDIEKERWNVEGKHKELIASLRALEANQANLTQQEQDLMKRLYK